MQGGGKSPKNEEDDVAYVTKSFILDLLIQALHEENVAIPLTLGNVKIIDWQLNKFISHIQLFNDEKNKFRNAIFHINLPKSK